MGKDDLARTLGEQIGFGNMMTLGQKFWREQLIASGYPPGGEFSIGPCVGCVVPCPHPESDNGGAGCDWCEGCGFLTKRVLRAIQERVETILAAAVSYNGTVYSLPAPKRHHEVFRLMTGLPHEATGLTNQRLRHQPRTLRRSERGCTHRSRSIREPTPADMLTSEDVW